MSSETRFGSNGSEGTDDEQDVEVAVAEQPELRWSVNQEIRSKVDTNHLEGGPDGMTLEVEERVRAQSADHRRVC